MGRKSINVVNRPLPIRSVSIDVEGNVAPA